MNLFYNPKPETWNELMKRPQTDSGQSDAIVKTIFEEVRTKGDLAVAKYTSLLDGTNPGTTAVTTAEILQAKDQISEDLKKAIATAQINIEKFHRAQQSPKIVVETMEGVTCWQEKKPIQKVGLYIPAGTAPLFSTVLMLAIPAQIAGCNEIILCSPPNKNGQIDPAVLYAAFQCGITKIYKIGGIQAIAAMTFGTATVPKVYKIFGPGNQYVTAAKQYAYQFGVAIDMPAGPSELLIVADESAVPKYIAADLLSQAEHGKDSQVILVSNSESLITAVEAAVNEQIAFLPRQEIAVKAIANSSLIYIPEPEDTLRFINDYAPEHLMICSENESFYIDGIQNAGSVFIGNFTPESAGDYASGTNHTLPTNGFSKNYSGVCLDSFLKSVTFQKISPKGLQNLGLTIEIMATAEGLDGHKNAVTLRLADLNETL